VNNNGTIVSCYPLNTPPNKFNFPARNRIISGLSKGCMVVQAAKKSGALITTQFGLDQGKQIFAIPGLIDNELSAGCHKLIQEGAKLVTKADDILEEFGETRLAETRLAETRLAETRQKKSQEQTAIFVDHPILKHLDQPTSIDELSSKTKISLLDLQNQLFSMQLEGTVQQNFVGLWESPPATKNQKTF
jgi:DNA processing protein